MGVVDFEDKRWRRVVQSCEFRHKKALELLEGDCVLDVGCGDGLFLELAEAAGKNIEGVDISKIAVEKASKKGFRVTHMEEGELPFPDNSFDTVVALDVLEHMYEPQILLKEMKRVSKNCIVVSVPNFVSLPARLQVLLGRVPENNQPRQGHIYWFTVSTLRSLFQSVDLHVIDFKGNTFWSHVPLVRHVIKLGALILPSVFMLSFVVRVYKKPIKAI